MVKKVQKSSVAPPRQRRTSPTVTLLEPFGCGRIYIRVNVPGVLTARCVGRMRKEPGMVGFAAIVAEPTSSGAKVNTEGSSTNGGIAPWIKSKDAAAGQTFGGACVAPLASATWVGHPG